MAAQFKPVDDRLSTDSAAPATSETADMIAQMRQLSADDPLAAQRLVTDVMAALDRATGGALREQLPDGVPVDGVLTSEVGAEAADGVLTSEVGAEAATPRTPAEDPRSDGLPAR